MNRAWTFIISKQLSETELETLSASGKAFVKHWTAHENKLSADFMIFKNRIIVVQVNEDVNNASGCSIDKLTRFIKESEAALNVELLNRFLIAYKNEGHVEVVHVSQVKELLAVNTLNENTIVYNTALANQTELKNWEQPLKTTWLSKYLQNA